MLLVSSCRRIVAVLVGATLAATALITVSSAFHPASAAANDYSATYNYTGGYQSFTVPNGVYQLPVTVTGGAGASGQGTNGGGAGASGGRVQGTLPVVPGEVLTLWVGHGGENFGGGGATDPGGRYGGGQGGAFGGGASGNGGGGGGASYILANGTPVVVAGGGGGGGGGGCIVNYRGGDGGSGGNPPGGGVGGSGLGTGGGGVTGSGNQGGNGGGGTQLGGGGGGGGGGYPAGTGGGGGYTGCGGGGGGGGGTSYADPSVQSASFSSAGNSQTTNGQISIDLGPAGDTHSYAGSSDYQTFVVPPNVTSVQITMAGASGGDARDTPGSTHFHGGRGGSGGLVTATLAVSPGQVLTTWVGIGGQLGGYIDSPFSHVDGGSGGKGDPNWAQFNGGHGGVCMPYPGCIGWGNGGGGGSASYILVNGSPVLVAGGGGGGGSTGGYLSFPTSPGAGPGGDGGGGDNPPLPGVKPDYAGFDGGAGGTTNPGQSVGADGANNSSVDTSAGGPGGGGGGGYTGGGGGGAGQVDAGNGDEFYAVTGGGGGGGGTSWAGPGVTGAYFSTAGNDPAGPGLSGNNGWITIAYRVSSTTTIASSQNPVDPGSPVTYTATVSGDGGGTVDFTSDGHDISGCGSQPLHAVGATFQATCSTTPNLPGAHQVAANYMGDQTYAPSSASLTETVNGYRNTATLSASANPWIIGDPPVTFEATGFSSVGTGTVSFTNNGVPIPGCTALPVSHRNTGSPWYARCSTTNFTRGPQTITATYSGDSLFGPASASYTEYAGGPVDHLTLSPSTVNAVANVPQTFKAEAYDDTGADLGDFTNRASFTISPDGTCNGSTCTAPSAGDHTVTATFGAASGTAVMHVTSVYFVNLRPQLANVPVGGSITYQAEGYDRYFDDLGDVTPATTFTVVGIGPCNGPVCTFPSAGTYGVQGYDGPAHGGAQATVISGAHLVVSPASASISAGGTQQFTAELWGSDGHDYGDATANTTFTISPDGSCSAATCTASTAGSHTVTGTDGSAAGSAVLTVNAVAPAAPTAVAATPGNGQATVTFGPPTSNGGSSITSYTVTATDQTNPAHGGQTATGNGSPITVTGLTNGDHYIFTVTASNGAGTGPASSATSPVAPLVGPAVMVQEFRLSGPGGSGDSYVELYNNDGLPLNLSYWALAYGVDHGANGKLALPAGPVPAGGHLLVAGPGYSLGSYASPDLTGLAASSDQGVAVVAPDGQSIDAAGMAGAGAGLSQGTPLTVPAQSAAQGAYVRAYSAGSPVDTGNNGADFRYVAGDVSATNNDGVSGATLGAPAPADLASPVNANAVLPSTLFAPNAAASASPNRIVVNNGGSQTLVVRRTITNNSNATIHTLRLLLTSVTTYGDTSAKQAILELVGSSADPAEGANAAATTLDSPPSAAGAGGLNSALTVALPGGALAPGQAVSVDIDATIVRGGAFSFGYNTEAS